MEGEILVKHDEKKIERGRRKRVVHEISYEEKEQLSEKETRYGKISEAEASILGNVEKGEIDREEWTRDILAYFDRKFGLDMSEHQDLCGNPDISRKLALISPDVLYPFEEVTEVGKGVEYSTKNFFRFVERQEKDPGTGEMKAVIDPEKQKQIKKVFVLMVRLHIDQKDRIDGKPYIYHLIRTARKLMKWNISDPNLIIATLLHDAIEDQAWRIIRCLRSNDVFQNTNRKLQEIEKLKTRKRSSKKAIHTICTNSQNIKNNALFSLSIYFANLNFKTDDSKKIEEMLQWVTKPEVLVYVNKEKSRLSDLIKKGEFEIVSLLSNEKKEKFRKFLQNELPRFLKDEVIGDKMIKDMTREDWKTFRILIDVLHTKFAIQNAPKEVIIAKLADISHNFELIDNPEILSQHLNFGSIEEQERILNWMKKYEMLGKIIIPYLKDCITGGSCIFPEGFLPYFSEKISRVIEQYKDYKKVIKDSRVYIPQEFFRYPPKYRALSRMQYALDVLAYPERRWWSAVIPNFIGVSERVIPNNERSRLYREITRIQDVWKKSDAYNIVKLLLQDEGVKKIDDCKFIADVAYQMDVSEVVRVKEKNSLLLSELSEEAKKYDENFVGFDQIIGLLESLTKKTKSRLRLTGVEQPLIEKLLSVQKLKQCLHEDDFASIDADQVNKKKMFILTEILESVLMRIDKSLKEIKATKRIDYGSWRKRSITYANSVSKVREFQEIDFLDRGKYSSAVSSCCQSIEASAKHKDIRKLHQDMLPHAVEIFGLSESISRVGPEARAHVGEMMDLIADVFEAREEVEVA